MENIAGQKSGLSWAVQISTILLVLLWVLPTFGLFVSSFRTTDQIASSGWWRALSTQERQLPPIRVEGTETQKDGLFVIDGTLFPKGGTTVSAWGTSSKEPTAYEAGATAELNDGVKLTVQPDGAFTLTSPTTTV